MDKAIIAAANDLYAQYSANPEWDDAKDVVEDLDVERLLAAADAAREVTELEMWEMFKDEDGYDDSKITDILNKHGLKVVRA